MIKLTIILLLMFLPTITYAAINKNLILGSIGTQVNELQSKLIKQGFLAAGNDSGYFGKNTQTALKKYQSSQGITPTGNTGPKTRSALNSSDTIIGGTLS